MSLCVGVKLQQRAAGCGDDADGEAAGREVRTEPADTKRERWRDGGRGGVVEIEAAEGQTC